MTLPSNSLTTLPDAPSLVGSLRPSIRFLSHTLQDLIQSTLNDTNSLVATLATVVDNLLFINQFNSTTYNCSKNPNASGVPSSVEIEVDTSALGDSLSYTIPEKPLFGTTEWVAGSIPSTIKYTPEDGFIGYDSMVVSVNDNVTSQSILKFRIFVRVFNSKPEASSQSLVTNASGFTPFSLPLTLIATDADADPLTYIITQVPDVADGTLQDSTSFTITSGDVPYTLPDSQVVFVGPSPYNFGDTASFQFKVNDGFVDSNTATVTLSATGNAAPVAEDIEADALVDTRTVIDFSEHFTDDTSNTGLIRLANFASLLATGARLFEVVGSQFVEIASAPVYDFLHGGTKLAYRFPLHYTPSNSFTPDDVNPDLGDQPVLQWRITDPSGLSSGLQDLTLSLVDETPVAKDLQFFAGATALPVNTIKVSANASTIVTLDVTNPTTTCIQRIVCSNPAGDTAVKILNVTANGIPSVEVLLSSSDPDDRTLRPVRSSNNQGISNGIPASQRFMIRTSGILPNANTSRSFKYQIFSASQKTSAQVTITVQIDATPPTALNSAFNVNSGSTVTLTLSASDPVESSSRLRYFITDVSDMAGSLRSRTGTLISNGSSFVVTPSLQSTNPSFTGVLASQLMQYIAPTVLVAATKTFKFRAVDESGFASGEKTITLNITP